MWLRERIRLQEQLQPTAVGPGNLTLLLFPICPRLFACAGAYYKVLNICICIMNKISNIEQKLAAEVLTSRDVSGTVRLYREGHFFVICQIHSLSTHTNIEYY